jgi:8-oxo-dGTP pyrophosphatase MutT (NUDIX family)
MQTPRANAARRELFERAGIEHTKNFTGFIESAE